MSELIFFNCNKFFFAIWKPENWRIEIIFFSVLTRSKQYFITVHDIIPVGNIDNIVRWLPFFSLMWNIPIPILSTSGLKSCLQIYVYVMGNFPYLEIKYKRKANKRKAKDQAYIDQVFILPFRRICGQLFKIKEFLLYSDYYMFEEKKEEIWLSPMTKAHTATEISKGQSDNTNNDTKKFDYTAVADRLRTVKWSNYGHPTGVVNLI